MQLASSSAMKTSGIAPIMLGSLSGAMGFTGLAAVLGPLLRHFGQADWIAGVMLSIAGVFWMMSGKSWGRLSSRWSCKQLLIVGLLGEGASLLLLAGVVQAGLAGLFGAAALLSGLFTFRALMSVFYSAVPVASSTWVANNTVPQFRTKSMALVGAAQGLGMILGPLLTALVSRFGLALPFWLAGTLPIAGAFFVWLLLPSALTPPSDRIKSELQITDVRIRKALITAFICWFAIVGAQLTIGFVAIDFLHLEPKLAASAAGATLASIGVAIFAAQIAVVRGGWPPRALVLTGAPIAALGVGFTPLMLLVVSSSLVMCLGFACGAFGIGLLMTAYQAASVDAVEPDEAGEASGYASAAIGAASVVSPFLVAAMYSLHPMFPYGVVSVMVASLFFLWIARDIPIPKH